MKKIFLLIVLFCLTGCMTTIDTFYSPKAGQFALKSVYLVNKGEGSKEMDERIKKELEKRNIKVVIGPETKKVTTEDSILKYTETWKTEITTYMQALDLVLFDANGEVIATSNWQNSKFSTLATVNSIVDDSIDVIFEMVRIKP